MRLSLGTTHRENGGLSFQGNLDNSTHNVRGHRSVEVTKSNRHPQGDASFVRALDITCNPSPGICWWHERQKTIILH